VPCDIGGSNQLASDIHAPLVSVLSVSARHERRRPTRFGDLQGELNRRQVGGFHHAVAADAKRCTPYGTRELPIR
jgi:hypothetical protein